MPSTEAQITALEEKVHRLEMERDAALTQVRLLQNAQKEKTVELGRERQMLSEAERLSHTGAWEWDLTTDQWVFSDEWLSIHGCDHRTLTMEDLIGLAHPDDLAVIKRAFQDVRNGIAPYHLEHRIIRPDGSVRHIRAHGQYVRDSSGKLVKIYGFTQDITEQVRIQQALIESEERYRTLFTTMTEGFAVGEPILDEEGRPKDFRFLEINEAFEKQSGLTPEIVGKPASTALPQLEPFWIETYCTVALTGEPTHFEQFNQDTGRWYEVYCYSPGRTRFAILFRDITEQRRMQERLAKGEERLQMALKAAKMGVWELDLRDKSATRTLEHDAIFGYEELLPEWTYEVFLEHVLPEDREEVDKKFQRAISTGRPWHFECRIRRIDGRIRWIDAQGRVYSDKTGETRRMVGVVEDITNRKRGDEALRKSEEKFRAVFEQAAVGIGRVSFDDARWIDVNDAFCRMLGYSPEEMRATPWPEITHPQDVDLDLIPFHRMAAGELDNYSVEKRFIHKEGHHVWARLTLSLVRDAEGQPDYEIAVIENITERIHAEEALKEAKATAEEASHAKSEFLANMSHEIRTPMTVFMAAIEHLLQTDRNPGRRHLLEMADQSAKRLRSLIDDILDISRIEARKVEIEEAQFDLQDCLREAVEMFALPAREKGLELEMEVEAEVPRTVIGDSDRLGQVLINLIGNAVKFTHKGMVRVYVRPRGDLLEFSVTDTGIGIPEDKLDLLFQSFSQVDASFTRQYGGTGLGLAISKGLVELMGGEISVQSHKGEGSVFTFSLPLKTVAQSCPAPAEVRPEAQPEASAEPQPDARLLLAEDDSMIREMITIMLSQKGLQVDTAETGEEALDKWASGNFDLILMDLQMPQMNGLEATRSIREKEAGGEQRTCIIGLTAHARREITDECLQAGMDRVLTKPVQIKDLHSAIDECLPG